MDKKQAVSQNLIKSIEADLRWEFSAWQDGAYFAKGNGVQEQPLFVFYDAAGKIMDMSHVE